MRRCSSLWLWFGTLAPNKLRIPSLHDNDSQRKHCLANTWTHVLGLRQFAACPRGCCAHANLHTTKLFIQLIACVCDSRKCFQMDAFKEERKQHRELLRRSRRERQHLSRTAKRQSRTSLPPTINMLITTSILMQDPWTSMALIIMAATVLMRKATTTKKHSRDETNCSTDNYTSPRIDRAKRQH